MKIALGIVLGLVGIVLLLAIVGFLLPKDHITTRAGHFRQKPDAIWKLITDIDSMPGWREGLKAVKKAPDKNGLPAWTEETKFGPIALETVELAAPGKMITRIADPNLPFGGTWTYEVFATEEGATLRITENGTVRNPIFRFLSRFVFGYDATMNGYLKSVARKFGEDPRVE